MSISTQTDNLAPLIERQRTALAKHQLRTNDLVLIDSFSRVQINGTPLRGLKSHDLTVFLILAVFAVNAPGALLGAKGIVQAIERGNSWLGTRGMSWSGPTAEAVHHAVYRVRRFLRMMKLNAALIESVAGEGYRLSTPALNVAIGLAGCENLARVELNALEGRHFSGERAAIPTTRDSRQL